MAINSDIQKLEPGSLVRLYELHLTELGGEIQRFHGHMESGPIIWQGNEYYPINIEVTGLEVTSNKTVTPQLTIGNVINGVQGAVSALCLYFNDFVGAEVRVTETFSHYLDAANFPEGNPEASDDAITSIWYIEQKTSENLKQLRFDLLSPAAYLNKKVPARPMLNRCFWCMRGEYRGETCNYTGPYIDINNNPTDNPLQDRCAGTLTACKARFGANAELPFGGHPSVGLLRR